MKIANSGRVIKELFWGWVWVISKRYYHPIY
jgi:hypothetical protein